MSEENKAIVRRFVEDAQGKGNLAAIYRDLAPSFVDHTPFPGFTPDRDGVRKLFGSMRTGLPDMTVVIHDQIAEGDKVVTRKTIVGTHTGELFGIPATGKSASIDVTDLLRVANGQIVEHWGIADIAGLMQQLGVTG